MCHSEYISQTIALARQARENGNHPFGAILVHNNKVILSAENKVCTNNDVTQHAELRLVSLASQKFPCEQLRESTLYTSTEPCAMCAGAIYWAGLRRVVFGVSASRLGELATGSFVVPSKSVFKHGKEAVELIGPINEAESEQVHRGFWT